MQRSLDFPELIRRDAPAQGKQKVLQEATWGSAIFSECRKYRYQLHRQLGSHPSAVTFVMLNPSTADAYKNDPTVARCMDFALRWDFGRLIVVNLFALRSTDPQGLYAANDTRYANDEHDYAVSEGLMVADCYVCGDMECGGHIEDVNDWHILDAATQSQLIVCAWGNHGAHDGRGATVLTMLRHDVDVHAPIMCLGVNKTGHPKHPLYARKDTQLQRLHTI